MCDSHPLSLPVIFWTMLFISTFFTILNHPLHLSHYPKLPSSPSSSFLSRYPPPPFRPNILQRHRIVSTTSSKVKHVIELNAINLARVLWAASPSASLSLSHTSLNHGKGQERQRKPRSEKDTRGERSEDGKNRSKLMLEKVGKRVWWDWAQRKPSRNGKDTTKWQNGGDVRLIISHRSANDQKDNVHWGGVL